MKITTLNSNKSINSYLLDHGNHTYLIHAPLDIHKVLSMQQISNLKAIFLTDTHNDYIEGLKKLLSFKNVPTYAPSSYNGLCFIKPYDDQAITLNDHYEIVKHSIKGTPDEKIYLELRKDNTLSGPLFTGSLDIHPGLPTLKEFEHWPKYTIFLPGKGPRTTIGQELQSLLSN